MPVNTLGHALRHRRAGHHTLVWARPDLQAPETFTLASPAFDHGAPIPERHRGRVFRANTSPALAWTPPPAGTAELVLVVQPPDAPFRLPATHDLTLGIDPSWGGIPENGLAHPSPVAGLTHGKGGRGRRGWSGPMPPRSHGPHPYVFQLFALDRRPEPAEGFGLAEALDGAPARSTCPSRSRRISEDSAATTAPTTSTRATRSSDTPSPIVRNVTSIAPRSGSSPTVGPRG